MRLNPKMMVAVAAASLMAGGAVAQNFERGMEFHDANLFETAKAYFIAEAKQNPSERVYYMLGDTYLMLGKVDSASFYFTKCNEMDPNFMLDEVGLGKIKLKDKNTTAAEELFTIASKKDKKNPEVFTAIAEAYATYGMTDKAKEMIAAALKAKKNYTDAYITDGDMLFAEKKYNDALQKYEQALYFDKNNKGVLLRNAKAYIYVNKELSLEILNKLTSMYPEYYPAYMELADYYYGSGIFAKAIEGYEKFINLPGVPMLERQNYTFALYFTQQYDKSLEKAAEILKEDPANFLMKRVRMYNNFEKEQIDLAYQQANEFFASKGEKDSYIAIDYTVFAKLLEAKQEYAKAVEMYEKVVELDPTKKEEVYKGIATMYNKADDYPNAIIFIEKALTETPEVVNAGDYYNFGRTFQNAASKAKTDGDTITMVKYLDKAVVMFDSLIVHNPDTHVGYMMKARSISVKDPELKQGLAKEAYETLLEKALTINEEGKLNPVIKECYTYLANFYYIHDQNDKAIEFFNKLLELDPENQQLKDAIKALKK